MAGGGGSGSGNAGRRQPFRARRAAAAADDRHHDDGAMAAAGAAAEAGAGAGDGDGAGAGAGAATALGDTAGSIEGRGRAAAATATAAAAAAAPGAVSHPSRPPPRPPQHQHHHQHQRAAQPDEPDKHSFMMLQDEDVARIVALQQRRAPPAVHQQRPRSRANVQQQQQQQHHAQATTTHAGPAIPPLNTRVVDATRTTATASTTTTTTAATTSTTNGSGTTAAAAFAGASAGDYGATGRADGPPDLLNNGDAQGYAEFVPGTTPYSSNNSSGANLAGINRPRITTRELQSAAEQSFKAATAIGGRAANRAADMAAPITTGAKKVTQQIRTQATTMPPFLASFAGKRATQSLSKKGRGHSKGGRRKRNRGRAAICASGGGGGDDDDDDDDDDDGAAVDWNESDIVDISKASDTRTVWINRPDRNHGRFPSNYVSTTKYSPWNAVPKFLFEQFTRFSNAYFLFVGILYCIDAVTPIFTFGRYSTLLVLCFVVAISGVKEGLEDLRRFRQDRRVNGTRTRIVGSSSRDGFNRWDSVKVGDILKVCNTELFPADMVLLASASEDGLAFVETKQLDGESNLKVKVVPRRIASAFSSESRALLVQGRVDCETPNDRLYKFNGYLTIEHIPSTVLQQLSSSAIRTDLDPDLPPALGTPVRNIDAISAAAALNGDPERSHSRSNSQRRLSDQPGGARKSPVSDGVLKRGEEFPVSQTGGAAAPASPQSHLQKRTSSDLSTDKVRPVTSEGLGLECGVPPSPPRPPSPAKDAASVRALLNSKIPLGPENLVIRGSSLRNTQWILGLVVNTGRDTKLMQNVKPRPRKNSRLERHTNKHYIISVLLELTICVACTIRSSMYCQDFFVNGFSWYFYRDDTCTTSENALRFLTFFTTFSGLIPISLYVSMEIVRGFQVYFFENDRNMVDPELGVKAEVRTSNLNEELGVVSYVFSDKTGTLTCNRMEFKKCSFANRVYSWSESPERGATRSEDLAEALRRGESSHGASTFSRDELDVGDLGFRLLAICHSVVAEVRMAPEGLRVAPSVSSAGDGNVSRADTDMSARLPSVEILESRGTISRSHDGYSRMESSSSGASSRASCGEPYGNGIPDILYQASSPDEAALVAAARAHGYMFVSRSNRELVIQVHGELEEYELLEVLEFDSTRKRMSVIVRCPNKQIRIFTKGADSVIFERLASDQNPVCTAQHLHDFAVEGLRTLCLAYADLEESFYNHWKRRYVQACARVTGREEAVAIVAEEVERNLILIGATAIEDKLQDGVPETLRLLEQAGVKVWVLTGDKQETAMNVGLSCGALDYGMEVNIMNEESLEDTSAQIDRLIGRWKAALLQDPGMESKLGLVIDGQTLHWALRPELEVKFMHLARMARTVIACRVSPKQKTELVELVRRRDPEKVTLAIGDGANDVGMIQAAHVGVGIVGLEGQEAKLASDYSIGQFRFLARLMLVHGRWSFKRLAKMVLFTIYKNMLLVMCDLYWSNYTGFTGQPLGDPWMGGIYNLFSSSLPPIIIGILDQELTADYALMFPEVYMKGQRNTSYNGRVYASWVFSGVWQSALLFYMTAKTIGEHPVWNGQQLGMWAFGTAVFTLVLVVMHCYALLYQSSFTGLTLSLYAISFLSWFVLGSIYSSAPVSLYSGLSPALYAVVYRVFEDPRTWLLMALLPVMCCSPQLLWKYYKRQARPNVKMLAQELIRAGRTRDEIAGDLMPKPLVRVPSYDPSAPPSPMNPATFVKGERQYAFSGFNFDGDEGISLLVRRHAYANSKGVRRRRMRVLKRAGSDTELDVTGVQTTTRSPMMSPEPAPLLPPSFPDGRRRARRPGGVVDMGEYYRSAVDESTGPGAHRRAMSDGAVLVEDRYERLANRSGANAYVGGRHMRDSDDGEAELESEGVHRFNVRHGRDDDAN